MLKAGDKLPSFSLTNQDGKTWKSKEVVSDFTVLFFYPKDDTGGCTLEGKGFTKNLKQFKKLKAEIVGISGGSAESKKKFCLKHNLAVTLLADEDFSVAKKFGAYGEKKFMGRKYLGIHRYTFVANKKGVITKVFLQVKPDEHPDEVLSFLLGNDKQQILPLSNSAPKKASSKTKKKPKTSKVVANKKKITKKK